MARITLLGHPEWQPEDLELHLGIELRKCMGPRDRDRLKALQCSIYIPPNIGDQLPQRTRAIGEVGNDGPLVQVVFFLARPGNDTQGKAVRINVPQCLPWKHINKLVEQVRRSISNVCKIMRKEESKNYMNLVTDPGVAVNAQQPDTAEHGIGVDGRERDTAVSADVEMGESEQGHWRVEGSCPAAAA